MAEYPTTDTDRHVDAGALKTIVIAIFEACGMSREDAATLGESLVHADLRGVHSHGVLRIPDYVGKLTRDGVDPRGQPVLVSRKGGALVVDGKNSMGQIGGSFAMDRAIEAARETGIALAALRGSNHCGALDWFTLRAAEARMIGIAASNALPTMAPVGGRDKIVGMNPISIAVPGKAEPPVVLDLAFGATAHGKIRVYHQKGMPIPDGWAFDAMGEPTTDAGVALDGLIQPAGGHKGIALAILVGMISTLLSGAKYGTGLGNMVDGPIAENDGQVFIAIDIAAFRALDAFGVDVDAVVAEIHGSARKDVDRALLVPGEMERNFERAYGVSGGASGQRDAERHSGCREGAGAAARCRGGAGMTRSIGIRAPEAAGAALEPELARYFAALTKRVGKLAGPDPGLATMRNAARQARLELSASGGDAVVYEGHGMSGRLFRPSGDARPGAGAAELVVYLHGGSWTLLDTRTHAPMMQALTDATGWPVLGLDCPLAPETRFPDTGEACLAEIRRIAASPDVLGAVPRRLVLAGDSCGANLAMSVALRLAGGLAALCGQHLVYGVFDSDLTRPSYAAHDRAPLLLTREKMDFFWSSYCGTLQERAEPFAAPLRAAPEALATLPPTLLTVAGQDVLVDENLAMAERLAAAGVPTATRLYPTAGHGFVEAVEHSPVARQALAEAAGWYRERAGDARHRPPEAISTAARRLRNDHHRPDLRRPPDLPQAH